jgi:uncharacterized protein YjbI with pentapeptide repeats
MAKAKTTASSLPDSAEPEADRKAKLQRQVTRNTARKRYPCEGVRIDTLGELNWLVAEQEKIARVPGSSLRADLSGLSANRANLTGADLVNVDLRGIRFRQVNLSGAQLNDANLSYDPSRGDYAFQFVLQAIGVLSFLAAIPVYIFVAFVVLRSQDFPSPNSSSLLELIRTYSVEFTRTINKITPEEGVPLILFSVIYIAVIGPSLVRFLRRYFERYELPVLRGSRISGNLSDTDLTGAKLRYAYLPGLNLQGATLEVADFYGAILRNADFHGAKLDNLSDNRRPKFGHATLSGARFDRISSLSSIIIDAQTKLDGVDLEDPFKTAPRKDLL